MSPISTTGAPTRRRGFERHHSPPTTTVPPRPVTAATAGRRVPIMRVVLVLCFAALALRLVAVQVLSGSRYSSLSAAEVTSALSVPAQRGTIYDRNGAVLAVSVPTDTVVGDPELISDPAQEAAALAPVLGIAGPTLSARLSGHTGYVVLATQVPDATAEKVEALDLAGINLLPTTQRSYPAGSLVSSVIGSVNASGAGDSGLEYQYNGVLAGRSGTELMQDTPDGVPLPGASGGRAAVPGTGLELTLDEPLQYEAEQALGSEVTSSHAKSGVAIVMDTHTGDILAMADMVANPTTGAVEESPENDALTSVYEPGSVFKIVTFSAALEDGLITPDEPFTVPPSITIGGYVFHDAESHPTEQLTATQILAQSSNLGTIEIAGLLGEDRLAAQVANLGFGQSTGLDFPGESPGLVNLDTASWSGSAMGSTPIGQDDAVTAQQVLDMVNSVATGGVFVSPRLVQATVSDTGAVHAEPAAATHRVFSTTVASELTTMMEQVVQDGTAVLAHVPGYTVAGKTGTAQIPGDGGYVPGAYMATFAGFAPAQDPALSAIVVLDQPTTPSYDGGLVAAPVFAQIMKYALQRYGIPPPSTSG